MRRLLPVLLLVGMLSAGPAFAVDTGTAVGVDPDATATIATTTRTLAVGADVSVGETVATGPTGQVQMLFNDATKLVVGPGSSLLIEDYLLRQDNSVGKFTINALAGTYRFVTGSSDKAAYEIKTPTGTIGVRGTAFDFFVDLNGTTTVILFHGGVHLCNLIGKCVDLTDQCELGSYDFGDSVVLGDGMKKRKDVRAFLPYVFVQAKLLPDFRVVQARRCLVTQPVFIVPDTDKPERHVDPGPDVEVPDDPTGSPTSPDETGGTPEPPHSPDVSVPDDGTAAPATPDGFGDDSTDKPVDPTVSVPDDTSSSPTALPEDPTDDTSPTIPCPIRICI